MTVKKLSVALEETVAESAAASARRQGLSFSVWLNRAAESALSIEAGLAAAAEWEADHGAFTPDEVARARAALAVDGVSGA